MPEVILALRRSLATLGRGRVWLYFLAPALFSLVAMVGLSVFLLERLIASFIEMPPLTWVTAWGALWLAKALAALGGWLIILSASYLLAVLLTAVIVLPLLLRHLAAVDYPDLAREGSDNLVASTWNSVWAALLFVAGWLLTMPLWLVPGVGLILPFFWMAWLNRRTFAYDALAEHANAAEWKELRRRQATPLFVLGLLMALLGHVPFIGLLAPSLAALAYIHFCLEALRRLRQGALVST
jgi:hypothetical protein